MQYRSLVEDDVVTAGNRPEEQSSSVEPGGEQSPRRTIYTLSEGETMEFGQAFGAQLRGGELVLLVGELGMGKTVFARGVAAGLGIDSRDVCSPSYTLIQEYKGGRTELFHIDLYRIEEPDEFATLGIEDLLASGGVVLAEWGERLPAFYRKDAIRVVFHEIGEDSRCIEIERPVEKPGPRNSNA